MKEREEGDTTGGREREGEGETEGGVVARLNSPTSMRSVPAGDSTLAGLCASYNEPLPTYALRRGTAQLE